MVDVAKILLGRPWMKKLLFLFFIFPIIAEAQERENRYEVEAGMITTSNMEIYGYGQANATQGWKANGFTYRLEYWNIKQDGWNFGAVFQPLDLNYSSKLTSNLNAKNNVFVNGNNATLNYQFPTMRFTGNYPVYGSDSGNYLRAGGSAIIRYAKVGLSSSTGSFSDTNLIPIPTINLETSTAIGGNYSLFTRSDFLPSIGGNVLWDGLYDVYFGVRKKLNGGATLGAGMRLFFGGYTTSTPGDYSNKIFFKSYVIRYTW